MFMRKGLGPPACWQDLGVHHLRTEGQVDPSLHRHQRWPLEHATEPFIFVSVEVTGLLEPQDDRKGGVQFPNPLDQSHPALDTGQATA